MRTTTSIIDVHPHSNTNNSNNSSTTPNSNYYYEHVARALTDFLETRGTLDVVPTDIVAGLLVLQRLQRQRILQARLQVKQSSETQLQLNMQQQRSPSILRTASSEWPTSSDVAAPSPLKQRSRTLSTNDLKNTATTITTTTATGFGTPQRRQPSNTNNSRGSHTAPAAAAAASLSITLNTSAGSLDLPETARLVSNSNSTSSDPQSQPIYRRCRKLEDAETTATTTTTTTTTAPTTSNMHYQAQPRQVLNPHNPIDCQRLQEGAHMAKYALAIYTWMLYLYAHPVKGLSQLLLRSAQNSYCHRRQRRRRSQDSLLEDDSNNNDSTTVGDNACQWHQHSLLLVAGLTESELVYAQFHNRFGLVPYCILLDHATQSVVVAIRGSLSLEDLVTDVNVDPESVEALGRHYGFDASNQYCHAGVVACAENVIQDLQRHGHLEQLFQHNAYPDYQLRLVGHSLGAATCTLLGYMLRPRYPALRVTNYSPPGCSMTWELATQCESWTTTFVLDSDIVPRLSVSALEDLRNDILKLVGRLKVPKYQVVQSFVEPRRYGAGSGSDSGGCGRGGCGRGCGRRGNRDRGDEYHEDLQELNQLIQDLLLPEEEIPDTLYQRQLQEFLQVQEQRKQTRYGNQNNGYTTTNNANANANATATATANGLVRMYPPGRMIHLVKTGEQGGCSHIVRKYLTCCTSNSGFDYTPVYIANDDLDEIVVSPTMGTDHFVDRIVEELNVLAEQYCGTTSMSTIMPHHGNVAASSGEVV
jgi:hypothetical protein